MKDIERAEARRLRQTGLSINAIARELGVAKSSVSVWIRDIILTDEQVASLKLKPFTSAAIEKRRSRRLANELKKRNQVQRHARLQITEISQRELWLMGVMLYWAEGGKTQRMVRFSNGDPRMIAVMMRFFRVVCAVPEEKFHGYIHIHPHLDHLKAQTYWSEVSGISTKKFFKTYRKPNIASLGKKDSLPNGVLDIYVHDTTLFLKISGWAEGIFMQIN